MSERRRERKCPCHSKNTPQETRYVFQDSVNVYTEPNSILKKQPTAVYPVIQQQQVVYEQEPQQPAIQYSYSQSEEPRYVYRERQPDTAFKSPQACVEQPVLRDHQLPQPQPEPEKIIIVTEQEQDSKKFQPISQPISYVDEAIQTVQTEGPSFEPQASDPINNNNNSFIYRKNSPSQIRHYRHPAERARSVANAHVVTNSTRITRNGKYKYEVRGDRTDIQSASNYTVLHRKPFDWYESQGRVQIIDESEQIIDEDTLNQLASRFVDNRHEYPRSVAADYSEVVEASPRISRSRSTHVVPYDPRFEQQGYDNVGPNYAPAAAASAAASAAPQYETGLRQSLSHHNFGQGFDPIQDPGFRKSPNGRFATSNGRIASLRAIEILLVEYRLEDTLETCLDSE
ncbi:unnamed protein product [Sphagnum balticum]